MDTAVTDPPVVTFTALDRCDRCGAQAYHKAEKGDLSLLLCNHDEEEHRDKLLETGWVILSNVTELYRK